MSDRRVPRKAMAGVVLAVGVAWLVAGILIGAARADVATPVPSAPTSTAPGPSSPGIFGPLVGGGSMAPPPALGPGLAPPGGSDPSWWDVPGQIEKAIDTWFGDLVKSALQPVLRLVGSTLLSSPDVSDGRIVQVWTGVLITTNSLYVLFVLVGAVIVMGHETVQTRYSVKEIAPRLVLGIVASNASLWAIEQSVSLGNALAAALMNGDLSAEGVGSRLTSMLVDQLFLPSGFTQLFMVLLGGAVAVMGIVLLVTCLVRAAILLTLTAGAPLALACHALPQTDGLAKLWWRAIIGCLATQVLQALVLITCVQVFFDPNADTLLGLPSGGGLTDLLLCLVLLFILIKIPAWTMRIALGRRPLGATFAGRLARSFLYYKAFTTARERFGGHPPRSGPSGSWASSHQPRPPGPGGGLRPFTGPRPGNGGGGSAGWRPGPPTVAVTRVDTPPPPGTGSPSALPGGGPPRGPLPPTPLGPVRRSPLALPVGSTVRRDRQHQAFVAAPPTRGVQDGLFPPVPKTAPAVKGAASSSPPRPGRGLRHGPMAPNTTQPGRPASPNPKVASPTPAPRPPSAAKPRPTSGSIPPVRPEQGS